jgi:hypothetical protein
MKLGNSAIYLRLSYFFKREVRDSNLGVSVFKKVFYLFYESFRYFLFL